ncbi:helix-turn-helix domain-containing protein [Kribbella albertanoniae]|uniref:XRE family transcriptional regulator n=1 Tax=Kribbella albertanoniae TaxID=1266829 RepID=A0A4R4Q1W0_9ACTN|nr:helix-turn-helix transcriptional regulator [Kribbella albertanoniae]TDC28924.1 XRE family transcriptional regulator [Kribbella albertanoniae]
MNTYSNWEDVKAKARAVDPRTPAERAAGKQAARERTEAYVRGHQLAEMRKAAGITQVRLAELLEVSQARISKIESGEVSGIEIIRAYVTALGGTVDLVATLGDRSWKVA